MDNSTNSIVETTLTDAWVNLIRVSRQYCPHGRIYFQIAAGEPKQILDMEPDIRLDKGSVIPPGIIFLTAKRRRPRKR